MYYTDPLNHDYMEHLKKSPQKSGDWDLKPGDFGNRCQIKPKRKIVFVMVFFTLLDIIYSNYFLNVLRYLAVANHRFSFL